MVFGFLETIRGDSVAAVSALRPQDRAVLIHTHTLPPNRPGWASSSQG